MHSPPRVAALDLLRFVAALLVVAHHWWWAMRPAVDLLPWFPSRFMSNAGYFGVTLFFTISGFVIVMSAEGKTPTQFARSRFVRLYPAFWVCCTLTWIVGGNQSLASDAGAYLLNMTMFPAAFVVPPVDGVYWTLAVEAKFYALVWMLLVFRRRLEPALWVWLSLSVLPMPASVESAIAGNYAPFFIAGCACYLLRERAGASRWALLACAVAAALWNCHAGMPGQARIMRVPDSTALGLAVTALMLAAVIAIALGWVRLPPTKSLALLGAMTYPLYLLHKEIGYRFFAFAGDAGFGTVAVAFVWILAMAWAVNKWAEIPLQRIMRRDRGLNGASLIGKSCAPDYASGRR